MGRRGKAELGRRSRRGRRHGHCRRRAVCLDRRRAHLNRRHAPGRGRRGLLHHLSGLLHRVRDRARLALHGAADLRGTRRHSLHRWNLLRGSRRRNLLLWHPSRVPHHRTSHRHCHGWRRTSHRTRVGRRRRPEAPRGCRVGRSHERLERVRVVTTRLRLGLHGCPPHGWRRRHNCRITRLLLGGLLLQLPRQQIAFHRLAGPDVVRGPPGRVPQNHGRAALLHQIFHRL